VIAFLQTNWLMLVFLAGAVAFYILLRNRATKVDGVEAILGQGQPVVVEVFSNT
jgi:hypothetical protein